MWSLESFEICWLGRGAYALHLERELEEVVLHELVDVGVGLELVGAGAHLELVLLAHHLPLQTQLGHVLAAQRQDLVQREGEALVISELEIVPEGKPDEVKSATLLGDNEILVLFKRGAARLVTVRAETVEVCNFDLGERIVAVEAVG